MKTLEGSLRGRGGGTARRCGGRGGRGDGRGGGRDQRFAARFTDPRFKATSSQHRPVHHNARDAMEKAAKTDPRFAAHFRNARGEEEEEEEMLNIGGKRRSQTSHEAAHSSSSAASSEESYSDKEGESSEADEQLPPEEEMALDDEVAAWVPDDVEFIEARRRIAVVNCDWDHVRAVDLYAILFHALPLGGQLHDVKIYMSDFGKRMIEHEKTQGPNLWVRDGEIDPTQEGGSAGGAEESGEVPEMEELPEDLSEDAISEPRSDGWADDDPNMFTEQGDEGEFFSSGKYRQYEMGRMKYYYAVATFDSPETAAAVYNELDGMDIEASGVVLDLRYIDDDEVFANPVSCADHIPPNFKPLASFKMSALSQSKFRISWDQDDVFRYQSVQDAFTGTTEEDDLAAYLAPADSDDERDGDPLDQEERERERRRIRRKYASLLAEVGGMPDDLEAEGLRGDGAAAAADGDNKSDTSYRSGTSNDEIDDSDDDALNRFSDVEVSDDEGQSDDQEEMMGDMEATFDMDADSRAVGLQRDARLKQKMKSADLAKQAELKYRIRRKEMKKSKKEMIQQERDAEKATMAAHQSENREHLKELLGTDDDGAVRGSGKERRKAHARLVKERLAEERAAKKKMRAANQLGLTAQMRRTQRETEARQAVNEIDERFKSKLLTDPRFHLEVSQKDKRVAEDVAQLASTVAKARQGKRDRTDNAPRSGDSVEDTLNFFLAKKAKRRV